MGATKSVLNFALTHHSLSKSDENEVLLDEREDEKRSKDNKYAVRGYISAFLGMMIGSGSIASSQLLGGSVPIFQLMAWRYSAQTLAVCLYLSLAWKRIEIRVSKERIVPILGCIVLQVRIGHSLRCIVWQVMPVY